MAALVSLLRGVALCCLVYMAPGTSIHVDENENGTAVVQLPSGDGAVRGFIENGYAKFRGVPYAAPPLGKLRWKPPQPVSSWKPEILNATTFQPNCLQTYPPAWYSIEDVRSSSEDCLYLDVYTPRDFAHAVGRKKGEKLRPVLLWIHGGDYQYGGSNDRENANPPPRSYTGDAVYVTVNYRLGVFGFLGAEQLRGRSPDNSTGNYGTQDQRAAIQWTRDNIEAFGGDPNRITIYGESAGAGSVTFHLVAMKSFPYYQRAITESGGFSQWVAKPMKHAQDNYEHAMKLLGLKPDDVDKLESLSSEKIIINTQDYEGYPWPDTMVQCQWAPVIDGVELLYHPAYSLQKGLIPMEKDVIFGSNRDEGTLFVSNNSYTHKQGYYSNADLPRNIGASQFAAFSLGSWGPIVGRMLVDQNLYPLLCHRPGLEYDLCDEGTYNTFWWAATRATGDFMMTCPARRAGRDWVKTALSRFSSSPLSSSSSSLRDDPTKKKMMPWVSNYYFAHTPLVSVNLHPTYAWGAFHGSEVPFVFHDDFELLSKAERDLSAKMVGYWSNFASSGNPNIGPTQVPPIWPNISNPNDTAAIRLAIKRWTPYTSDYNELNISSSPVLRNEECNFWDSVNAHVIYPNPMKEPSSTVSSSSSSSSSSSFSSSPSTLPMATSTISWGEWSSNSLPPMPTPRALFGTAALDSVIYCFGGIMAAESPRSSTPVSPSSSSSSSSSSPSSSSPSLLLPKWVDTAIVETFDVGSGTWALAPPLTQPRSGVSGIAVASEDGKPATIYAVGGMLGRSKKGSFPEIVDVVERFTRADNKWKRLASLPSPRCNAALAASKSSIFAVGGFGVSSKNGRVEPSSMVVYDIDRDSWKELEGTPTKRTFLTAFIADQYLHAVGGMAGFFSLTGGFDNTPMASVETYDISKNQWVKPGVGSIEIGRHSAAGDMITLHDGSRGFIILGGSAKDGDTASVEMLVMTKRGKIDTLLRLPDSPISRTMHGVSAVQGCVYAIGGIGSQQAWNDPYYVNRSGILGSLERLCELPQKR